MLNISLQQIDLGMTIQYYIGNQDVYQKEECFLNAFTFLRHHITDSQNIQIIFGYVLSEDGIKKAAVRHAWNLYRGYVVDVTMPANDISPMSMLQYDYLPVEVYSAKEYLQKLEELDGKVCFPVSEREKEIRKQLLGEGYEVLG